MSKPINVLFLVPTLRIGSGVASFAMSYFREINKDLVHIDFACYLNRKESYESEVINAGCNVFYLPSVFHIIKHIYMCKEILMNGHYDIIHNNSLLNTIPFMFISSRFTKVRILHSHNSKLGDTCIKALRNRIFLPLLRSLATDYAACSDLAAKALFGHRKYSIIPNIIDGNRFFYNSLLREELRNKYRVSDKIIVGSVGRVTSQKNPRRAILIMKEVIKQDPKIEFWWAGIGPLLNQMETYIKKNKLEKNIKMLGNCANINNLYQIMDVLFMPSKFEGFGIACVEAQITGLNCIVSDTLPKEVSFSNLVDFIPLSKDNTYWARHILNVVHSCKTRKNMESEFIKSNYSNINSGRKLEEYYRKILEK